MLSVSLVIALGLQPQDPVPYEVRWEAPPECGTAEDVRTQVAKFGVASTPNAAPLAVAGTVTRNDDGSWRLTLVLEREGHPRARALEAPRCTSLIESAAFIIAVALDPDAGDPRPEPKPDPTPTPAPAPPPEPEPEQPPAPARARALFVQIGGGVRMGAWPLGGTTELTLGVQGPAWRVEVGGAYDPPREFEGSDPSVAMRLQAGRAAVRGCYASAVGKVVFPTCATAEVGGLDASGRQLETNLQRGRPWLAFGMRGGVEAELVGPVSLALTVDALLPVIQHEFLAGPAPEVLIHRIGPAEIRMAGQIRVRFR